MSSRYHGRHRKASRTRAEILAAGAAGTAIIVAASAAPASPASGAASAHPPRMPAAFTSAPGPLGSHARPLALTAYRRHPRQVIVAAGDSLSAIGARHGMTWRQVWALNPWITDPDFILPGWHVRVRGHAARHALSAPSGYIPSGTLSCGGLEALWARAGGARSIALLMASIAMAESGGGQYATGPVYGEEGYWQISPTSGYTPTYDPLGNARLAVTIEANSGLTAWTTYVSGAYIGRC